jgi:hypothetical protein
LGFGLGKGFVGKKIGFKTLLKVWQILKWIKGHNNHPEIVVSHRVYLGTSY